MIVDRFVQTGEEREVADNVGVFHGVCQMTLIVHDVDEQVHTSNVKTIHSVSEYTREGVYSRCNKTETDRYSSSASVSIHVLSYLDEIPFYQSYSKCAKHWYPNVFSVERIS